MTIELNQISRRHAAHAMGKMRRLHFVGIGGSGMNGIAQVMLNLGYEISGSDLSESQATERLSEQGAKIFLGHRLENIEKADAVIISSAVKEDNPEVMAAKAQRIPVVPRAEMLAEIMRFHYGVAVAGTHGKTTTTSLIASLLIEGELDPTFVIGGRLNSAGSHARLGKGEVLVAEADESDASFLYLQPMLGVVTNLDEDHMETYGGDYARLRDAFLEFLHHLPFYGLAVLCIDDQNLRELLPDVTRRVVTYGLSEDADIRAVNVRQEGRYMSFDVMTDARGKFAVKMNMPGQHNVLNALAAIAVAIELDVETVSITQALRHFQGIGRRFQVNELSLPDKRNLLMIDDYGHHPREIEATVRAVREGWPDKRLVLMFQPHRYTRTQDLFEDFVQVLSDSDVLVLTEVFAAGEAVIQGADGRSLARAIRMRAQVEPVFVNELDEIPDLINSLTHEGDILLLMGAGNIGAMAQRLVDRWAG